MGTCHDTLQLATTATWPQWLILIPLLVFLVLATFTPAIVEFLRLRRHRRQLGTSSTLETRDLRWDVVVADYFAAEQLAREVVSAMSFHHVERLIQRDVDAWTDWAAIQRSVPSSSAVFVNGRAVRIRIHGVFTR